MYLIPIVVPIFVDGPRRLVTTEWKRSLELLRDSFHGEFGPLGVIAPTAELRSETSQRLETLDEANDGIRTFPSIPYEIRSREYWTRYRAQWLADFRAVLDDADVVHTGLDDLYRPRMFDAFRAALSRGKPTVFVQDTDAALQIRELNAGAGRLTRLRWEIYCRLYERCCRWGVARASLSLLKGRRLIEKYGSTARRAEEFHDTSYLSDEIPGDDVVARRFADLHGERPLRFVYCGRFIARKGILDGLAILADARRRGARIELDLIGDGDERPQIERRIAELGLGSAVRLLGNLSYGPTLIERLATYDALYFTPPVEDTPRMIFDGYAASLPLVATDIDYVCERSLAEEATVLLPRADHGAAAEKLLELDRRRVRLAELSEAAARAGVYHAADAWYRRRAEWTFEAVGRTPAWATSF